MKTSRSTLLIVEDRASALAGLCRTIEKVVPTMATTLLLGEGGTGKELFGHEKGAFTGAVKQMPGKFELANNDTL